MKMAGQKEVPCIYVVSDSVGETGELAVRAASIQFHPVSFQIRRFAYIDSKEKIDALMEEARQASAVIVFTLVIPDLRDYLIEQALKYNIISIDLLGPIIGSLEKVLGRPSRHIPGIIHRLDEDYFKKVDAVEFAVKYDDGRDPRGILQADIVLVGVSRTSKTPLSMYLAHKKFKVANVPLVPELKPPDELFAIDGRKIVGLKINPDKLNMIRKERLKALGLAATASYANMDRIKQELVYADEVMKRLGCLVIDVSNKAVEETAGIILDAFRLKS